MTVCIAALAEGGRAIVLMADKQLTGGHDDLKANMAFAKAMWISHGWLALFAGSPTFAEMVLGKANQTLRDSGKVPTHAQQTVTLVRDSLLYTFRYCVDKYVLGPRALDAALYEKGGYDAVTRRELEIAISDYARDETCDLILCGFDTVPESPFPGNIFTLSIDGFERERAFAAIGSGARVASAHLTWRGTGLSDRLARVLYEVYEAKSHAEMNAYVSEDLDAWVMCGNGRENLREISVDTKYLLRAAFRFNDQTPFKTVRRDDEVPLPDPGNWEDALIKDQQLVLPAHLTPTDEGR